MATGPPGCHMAVWFMGNSWEDNLSAAIKHTDTIPCPSLVLSRHNFQLPEGL